MYESKNRFFLVIIIFTLILALFTVFIHSEDVPSVSARAAALYVGSPCCINLSDQLQHYQHQRRDLNKYTKHVKRDEVPMARFVPENKHTECAAEAAAKHGEAQKHALRNTPGAHFCLELIYAVKHKGNERYRTEGYKNYFEK